MIKKIIFIWLLCFWFVLLIAVGVSWGGMSMMVGGGVDAVTAMTPFIETFTSCSADCSTGCDNAGWTLFGRTSECACNSTTATIVDDGQQLQLNDTLPVNGYTGAYNSFEPGGNRYLFLKKRPQSNQPTMTDGDSMYVAGVADSSGTMLCAIGLKQESTTPHFLAYSGAAYSNESSVVPTQNTTYWVWVEFIKNTSCNVFVSTTATKPETATSTISTGVPNTDAARVYVQGQNLTGSHDYSTLRYDRIKIKDSAWGDDGN